MLAEGDVEAFRAVMLPDEQIVWSGRPLLVPFVASGIPYLLFGLLWGAVDYWFFIRTIVGPSLFTFAFFGLHLFPCYGSILNIARLILVHDRTQYAATNRRLLLRTGLLSRSVKLVELAKVSELEVKVGLFEGQYSAGTLWAYVGVGSEGERLHESFVAIPEPYEALKRIRQASRATAS